MASVKLKKYSLAVMYSDSLKYCCDPRLDHKSRYNSFYGSLGEAKELKEYLRVEHPNAHYVIMQVLETKE